MREFALSVHKWIVEHTVSMWRVTYPLCSSSCCLSVWICEKFWRSTAKTSGFTSRPSAHIHSSCSWRWSWWNGAAFCTRTLSLTTSWWELVDICMVVKLCYSLFNSLQQSAKISIHQHLACQLVVTTEHWPYWQKPRVIVVID